MTNIRRLANPPKMPPWSGKGKANFQHMQIKVGMAWTLFNVAGLILPRLGVPSAGLVKAPHMEALMEAHRQSHIELNTRRRC